MEVKNYICGGSKFSYSKGYIALPVEVGVLPETVVIEGETLQRKTSFHVSLLCVKEILEKKPDAEQHILDTFCAYVADNDISFAGYTGEFRFAQNEERKTLIALCNVTKIADFSRALGEKLGLSLPIQPTHITLYTLQPDMGIGLNSPEDMAQKSIMVEVPAVVKSSL
jgi:hypothetical protein